MNLEPLLNASPAIQIHTYSAIAAFVFGGAILWRRKGGKTHRALGRIWVALMLVVCLTAFFIHQIRVWGEWSPIHLLAAITPLALARAVWAARNGNIVMHRRVMRTVYLGALVLAGLFTFLPGRILYKVVFEAGWPAPLRAVALFIAGTPIWVWPLLAALLWLGISRLREQTVSPARVLILPAVFAVLATISLVGAGFGVSALAGLFAGALSGYLAAGAHAAGDSLCLRDDGLVRLRGEAMPLVLSLVVFLTRYVAGAIQAVAPQIATMPVTIAAVTAVSGFALAFTVRRALTQTGVFAFQSDIPGPRFGRPA